jgi:hypothetical protein
VFDVHEVLAAGILDVDKVLVPLKVELAVAVLLDIFVAVLIRDTPWMGVSCNGSSDSAHVQGALAIHPEFSEE